MKPCELLNRLDIVAREFAQKRTSKGYLMPGILRLSPEAVNGFRECETADWESHHWRIFESELQAFKKGSDADLIVMLKRILNSTGVAVVGVELAPEVDLEIVSAVEREFGVFLRELPRLLSEGEEGRHALIQGEKVSIWDTLEDGYQHALDKFGIGTPFLVQPIERRFLDYGWQAEVAPRKAV